MRRAVVTSLSRLAPRGVKEATVLQSPRRKLMSEASSSLTRSSSTVAATWQNNVIPDGDQQRKAVDPFVLVEGELATMFREIHSELDHELEVNSELGEMSKYYFDGQGKALRPVIAMCVGHAFNQHSGEMTEVKKKNQRKVAIISEMIHTASLVHDDVLDHAETRRGKVSVNTKWDCRKSAMCGDYILAVGSKLLAQVGNQDVVEILSQVLADLVQGEFMQLQNKEEESERFEHYLSKSFNKTASLMAYSCKANAVLSGVGAEEVQAAFQYGRKIGIAFQLVDDLLDFVSSADQLGKPAAADLKLGLATAPVLFASAKYPELNEMIERRFSQPGDVETAFQLVLSSNGLEETRELARTHCREAIQALDIVHESEYKAALVGLCDKVLHRLK